jgi:hypothetical protein
MLTIVQLNHFLAPSMSHTHTHVYLCMKNLLANGCGVEMKKSIKPHARNFFQPPTICQIDASGYTFFVYMCHTYAAAPLAPRESASRNGCCDISVVCSPALSDNCCKTFLCVRHNIMPACGGQKDTFCWLPNKLKCFAASVPELGIRTRPFSSLILILLSIASILRYLLTLSPARPAFLFILALSSSPNLPSCCRCCHLFLLAFCASQISDLTKRRSGTETHLENLIFEKCFDEFMLLTKGFILMNWKTGLGQKFICECIYLKKIKMLRCSRQTQTHSRVSEKER